MKLRIASSGVVIELTGDAGDLADAFDMVLERAAGIGELLGVLDSAEDGDDTDGGDDDPGGPGDDDPAGTAVDRLLSEAGISTA